ncbi:MAG: YCF48-related protein [Patescibacteria group bacterium]
MLKFKSIFFITIMMVTLLSGCSISFGSKDSGSSDGGVFVSANKGNTWQQKALIPNISGKPRSMAGVSVSVLVMDPNDNKAIYQGSIDNGLFYTYNIVDGWLPADSLGRFTISAAAVDPESKCIIYAAAENKVYKSTDCNRSWAQVYFDNDTTTKINSIAIDHYNSQNVFIGTSRGEIIRSIDRGISWKTLNRFENSVEKIIINPHDSRMIFVGTARKGIFRSKDSGLTWQSLSEQLKDFQNVFNFKDLALANADQGLIILATSYGLLKSNDYGDNWSKIELITPEKKSTINALAINPKNSQEIYYVTDTTFYRSLDGGQSWTSKKLPSTRAGWKLLIDPENPNTIYLGVKALK